MKPIGTSGAVFHGGYLYAEETNAQLNNQDSRYKIYADILSNTSIVSAGVRYFLNLVSKADWNFEASELDRDGKYAELAEEILTSDPATPWHRIVRRAAMYRFYGYSIQEWTAKRRPDGWLTYDDIAPRPQKTIYRWEVDPYGNVLGAYQTNPENNQEVLLPRNRILYLVDDALSNTPEGMGVFRHLVSSAQRLARYEQLEGFGFETDLRGIPIGRAPFTDLAEKVKNGIITPEQRSAMEAPLRSFIQNHIKSAKIGILLDSLAYESQDDSAIASNIRQWDIEVMKGSATSFAENAAAILRLNQEIARVLGVEQLLLGEGNAGSYALSRDKTSSFFLMVDSALTEIKEAVTDDLLTNIWKLNGWDDKMKPVIRPEGLRYMDVSEVTTALRDMGLAGAVLAPDDPVIRDVRAMMGVSVPNEY